MVKGFAAPAATLSGSALWGRAPAADVAAAYEQTPDAVQEQLFKALRLVASTISVDVSELSVKSMRVLTPAERKEHPLKFLLTVSIANDLAGPRRLAVKESVCPEEEQAFLEAIAAEPRS